MLWYLPVIFFRKSARDNHQKSARDTEKVPVTNLKKKCHANFQMSRGKKHQSGFVGGVKTRSKWCCRWIIEVSVWYTPLNSVRKWWLRVVLWEGYILTVNGVSIWRITEVSVRCTPSVNGRNSLGMYLLGSFGSGVSWWCVHIAMCCW